MTEQNEALARWKSDQWYEQIEEPVRGLVKRLRDVGINTTSSCGHELYIQADIIPDGDLLTMHRTVSDWLDENGVEHPDYTIDIHLIMARGVLMGAQATIALDKTRAEAIKAVKA